MTAERVAYAGSCRDHAAAPTHLRRADIIRAGRRSPRRSIRLRYASVRRRRDAQVWWTRLKLINQVNAIAGAVAATAACWRLPNGLVAAAVLKKIRRPAGTGERGPHRRRNLRRAGPRARMCGLACAFARPG